jgi:dimethylhistidine N-methyltransferase
LPLANLTRPLGHTVVLFLGSTIGNLEPDQAAAMLADLRSALHPGDALLLGADLRKDPSILEPAYYDALGVTAAFNLNLLQRFNRELGGDFDPQAFDHRAVWNVELERIEMHLVSRVAQRVTVAGQRFGFAAGESIHTENSHKFTPASFARLAEAGGWRVDREWISPDPAFGVFALVVA